VASGDVGRRGTGNGLAKWAFKSPPASVSNYVCREHPTRPTTWRGTGCPECMEHLRQSIARRLKRRQEARADG